jgi:hypothetical protein
MCTMGKLRKKPSQAPLSSFCFGSVILSFELILITL